MGLGIAFKDGLEEAVKLNADIIVNIDADGQYNPKEIDKLIQPIIQDKSDIVLGVRAYGDGLKFMPLTKKIGNKIATWIIRRVTGLPIIDAQTGFRAFSRDAALKLNLTGEYTHVHETLIQARFKGLKIEQVPVEFRRRKNNEKSRLIPNIWAYAKNAGGIILRTYRDYKPLKFFTITGGIFTFIGFLKYFY